MLIDISSIYENDISIDPSKFPKSVVVVTSDGPYDIGSVKKLYVGTYVDPLVVIHNVQPAAEYEKRSFRAFPLEANFTYEATSYRSRGIVMDAPKRSVRIEVKPNRVGVTVLRNDPKKDGWNHTLWLSESTEIPYPHVTWELIGKGG